MDGWMGLCHKHAFKHYGNVISMMTVTSKSGKMLKGKLKIEKPVSEIIFKNAVICFGSLFWSRYFVVIALISYLQ